jgi:hypothetical protein
MKLYPKYYAAHFGSIRLYFWPTHWLFARDRVSTEIMDYHFGPLTVRVLR